MICPEFPNANETIESKYVSFYVEMCYFIWISIIKATLLNGEFYNITLVKSLLKQQSVRTKIGPKNKWSGLPLSALQQLLLTVNDKRRLTLNDSCNRRAILSVAI